MIRQKALITILIAAFLLIQSCFNEAVFHTVSFETGNSSTKEPLHVKDGYRLTENDLKEPESAASMVFSGWFSGQEKIESGYKVVSDITLQAAWEKADDAPEEEPQKSMVLLEYFAGGKEVPQRKLLEAGSTLEKEHLYGEEWYIDNVQKAYPGYILNNSTVLVRRSAGSQGGPVRLTFHSDIDGTGYATGWDIPSNTTAEGIVQPLPDGATGWQTAGGTVWDPRWPIYDNLDLYPIFDSVNITFITGKGIPGMTMETARGAKIPVPLWEVKDNYSWYIDENGREEWDFEAPALSDTTLYHLKDSSAVVTIFYDNSGYGTAPADIKVKAGTTLGSNELPELSAAGVGFIGWKDQQGVWVKAGEYTIFSDTTLHAVWAIPGEKGKITEAWLRSGPDSLTLSWLNPSDLDFEYVRIEIRKDGSLIGMETTDLPSKPGERITHVFENLTPGTEYKYTLYPVFAGDVTGEAAGLSGITSRYAGAECWVYGITPPDESRWMDGSARPYVVWEEGDLWFDVNKTYWADLENNLPPARDSNLCWAAGAASVLHWWMNMNEENIMRYGRYEGPSWDFPSDVKNNYNNAASKLQTSEIFQYFIQNSYNEAGYDEEAVNWFIAGNDGYLSSPILNPSNTGGFFKDVFEGRKLSTLSKKLGKASFSKEIAYALETRKGICYSAAPLDSTVGHIMTIWGAGFDEQGYVAYLYTVDNNPSEGYGSVITPRLEKNAAVYGTNAEGASYVMVEYGRAGNHNKIRDYRLISLGEEVWQDYFAALSR